MALTMPLDLKSATGNVFYGWLRAGSNSRADNKATTTVEDVESGLCHNVNLEHLQMIDQCAMAPTVYTVPSQTTLAPTAQPGWVIPYHGTPTHTSPHPGTATTPLIQNLACVPDIPIPLQAQMPALGAITQGHVQQPYPLSVTMCMEVVWHGEFEKLFDNFLHYHQHKWTLTPTATVPENADSYNLFQDSAKVRFSCDFCGRGWTSMKGRVAFWFRLNHVTQSGEILFKLFGQQCQKCANSGREKMHHAMWYPEEVVKVVQNLYNRVGNKYYGFQLPPIRIDRRTGKPRAQHDSKLCQACKDGICREGWTIS